MAFSDPVVVLAFSRVGDSLHVLGHDGCNRVMRLGPSADVDALLVDLASLCEDEVPVVFESFGSWSADRWFYRWSEFRRDITLGDFDVVDLAGNDRLLSDLLPAIRYAFKRLRIPNSVTVNFVIRPWAEEGRTLGWCNGAFKELDRYRVMVAHCVSMEKTLDTLFHELRHVAQFHHGILDGSNWKGSYYNKDKIDYNDYPWEVDARKAAAIMVKDYLALGDK